MNLSEHIQKAYIQSHPCCQYCKDKGLYKRATHFTYIIPPNGNLVRMFSSKNMIALCDNCYSTFQPLKAPRGM